MLRQKSFSGYGECADARYAKEENEEQNKKQHGVFCILNCVHDRSILSMVLWFARQHNRAIEELHKVIDMDANFAAAHSTLGLAYAERRMCDEAIAECQRRPLSPAVPAIPKGSPHAAHCHTR